MMRSDLVFALIVGVLLILLIILISLALPQWQGDTRSHQTAKSQTRPQAVCRPHSQARLPRL